jgi:hypothetical protein
MAAAGMKASDFGGEQVNDRVGTISMIRAWNGHPRRFVGLPYHFSTVSRE